MTKPPSPERIRLTITVTPEVHAAFKRMAEVSGMSIGRAMGDWLGDTLEGVEMITGQLAKARQAPRQVVAEMRQLSLGAVDMADEILDGLRSGRLVMPPEKVSRARPGAPGPAASPPRPVIRGGKSQTGKTKGHK